MTNISDGLFNQILTLKFQEYLLKSISLKDLKDIYSNNLNPQRVMLLLNSEFIRKYRLFDLGNDAGHRTIKDLSLPKTKGFVNSGKGFEGFYFVFDNVEVCKVSKRSENSYSYRLYFFKDNSSISASFSILISSTTMSFSYEKDWFIVKK